MAIDQTTNPVKQNDQTARNAEAAEANINRAAEQGRQLADAAREGLNTMTDLREQATESTKQVVQRSVETVSHHAREATERFTRTLGFSGEESERLARQSKQNMDAVTRCGTVLTQAFQDATRSWFGLAQKQFQHNLDGMNKLTRAKSLQEFTAIQSELVREGLQHLVQDSKAITVASARAIEEASKTFSSVAHQGSTLVR